MKLKIPSLLRILTEGEPISTQVYNKYVVVDEHDPEVFHIDPKKMYDYLKRFDNKDVDAEAFMDDEEGFIESESYYNHLENSTDKEIEEYFREEMSYYFFSNSYELG
jgi:hypothetical protein